MPRPLTKVEQGYIRDCLSRGEEDAKVIAKELAGVGPVTVQAFVDGYMEAHAPATEEVPPSSPAEPLELSTEVEEDIDEETIKPLPGETELEHKARIASSRTKTSDLMGRRDGITVMTEAASELADARKSFRLNDLTPEQRERQAERIHKPFNGENQGGAKDTSTRVRAD
jgi:hypothetical protein